jgi:three-Cys-motif partner protein
MAQSEDRYCSGDDGLIAEKVGPWAATKMKLLTEYIDISSAARRKFTDSAYIDLFCGPGRSKNRDNGTFNDGSAVAAFKAASASLAGFHSIEISDARPDLMEAAEQRLKKIGAPVRTTPGPALDAVDNIVSRLNKRGLYLVLLDPHNLGALSFDLFKSLSTLRSVDIIVHVSVSDLQRNAGLYTGTAFKQFDNFAPGWRTAVGTDMNHEALRRRLIEYWTNKLVLLGLPRAKHHELVVGTRNQPLYWLMLISRHKLAHNLWSKITSEARSPKML